MNHLAFFVIGPLRIELDGKPVQTSRHKALALLVYLAMRPGKQSREALSAFLWPEYEQQKAYAYLRRTLWEAQSILGEGWLEADREEIGFTPGANIYLDIAEFQSHLAAIQQHDHPTAVACQGCIAHLHTAALLYRGGFMSEFHLRDSASFEDWQFFQREALRRDYASALQRLVSLLYQKGSFNETATFAQRWLALDNFNEEAHRLLMKLYAQNGQRHTAVRQYQECQKILQTELGVVPEQATTALYEAIVSGEFNRGHEISLDQPQPLSPNAPEPGSVTAWLDEALSARTMASASKLPTPSTRFIGRQPELSQIATLLADPGCWLLTLVGPGGIGKTRLALEAGLQLEATFALEGPFAQRVVFIPLSMVETEQSLAPTMARALGLVFRQNGSAPLEQLLDFLHEKHLLLILDSFEQLVPWASLLERIHSHAAGIKMLVTSRHRLLLQGEWVMEIKGLDYPPQQAKQAEVIHLEALQSYSAVECFLHAARRAQVTFEATQQDLSSICQLAQLLEGMPLGLELAATWINTLSCPEIVNEISRKFDFLETTFGNISERQRSMRAVFDHSWNLLSGREQTLLPRLAVFRGSFSRTAAQQVAGISLRELAGLIDKSLVRRTPQGRFDLHDLLRQYCAEKLDFLPGDSQETHQRHCIFYSSQLAQWNTALSGERQGQILREIEAELENIQAAWEWAVIHRQFECLEQAVDGLCMVYLRRARFAEGREACQKAAEAVMDRSADADQTQRARLSARLIIWQAELSINLDCLEDARQLLQESQLILDDPRLDHQQVIQEQIFGLFIQAALASLLFDPTASLCFYEQAFCLSQKASGKGYRFWVFFWRFLMGGSVSKELYLLFEKNLADIRQTGDPFEIGCHLFVLGIAELFHNYRMDKAEMLLRESCANFQLVDDPSMQAMVFKTLGYILEAQGKFADYDALKQRELEIWRDFGDRRMVGSAQAEISEALCHLGKYSEAEDQIRTGMACLQGQSETEYALRQRYLGDVLLAQGKNQAALEAYQSSYRFFQSVNEKGWMLTALTGVSRAEFALGNRSDAWMYANQALHLVHDVQLFTFFAYLTVAQISLLLADRGAIVQALELYGLVTQQGYLAQSRWFADLYGRYIEEAASPLSLEERVAALERGQALDFSKTVVRLLNPLTDSCAKCL